MHWFKINVVRVKYIDTDHNLFFEHMVALKRAVEKNLIFSSLGSRLDQIKDLVLLVTRKST